MYMLFVVSIVLSFFSFIIEFMSKASPSMVMLYIILYCIVLFLIFMVNGWLFNIYYVYFFKSKGYEIASIWLYPFLFDKKNKKNNKSIFISFMLEIFSGVSFESINNYDDYEKYEDNYNRFLRRIMKIYIVYSLIISGVVYILSNNILFGLSIGLVFVAYLFVQSLGENKTMGTAIFYALKDKNKLIYCAYKNSRMFNENDKSEIYNRMFKSIKINNKLDNEGIEIIEQAIIDSIYDEKRYFTIEQEEEIKKILFNTFESDTSVMLTWFNVLSLYAIYIYKFKENEGIRNIYDAYERVKKYADEVLIMEGMPGIKAIKRKINTNYNSLMNHNYEEFILYDKYNFYINIDNYNKKIDLIKR